MNSRRRRSRTAGARLLAVGCIGLAALMFALTTGLDRLPGASDGSLNGNLDADRLARAIGLGIEQVQLAGHRHTLDGDNFRALGLDQPGSQLSFDVSQRRRIH